MNDSFTLGNKAETRFKQLAEKRGWTVSRSTTEENIDEHWDFLIDNHINKYKVDVKSAKRLSRYDIDVQDVWVWIELHSVRPNNKGWLYDGKADLISFEKINSFIIVKRVDLIGLVEKLVDLSTAVYNSKEAKYKVYNRQGRLDSITMIETMQLDGIKWDEWA